MPNTGRSYAPYAAATAPFRDRYACPYTTTSSPVARQPPASQNVGALHSGRSIMWRGGDIHPGAIGDGLDYREQRHLCERNDSSRPWPPLRSEKSRLGELPTWSAPVGDGSLGRTPCLNGVSRASSITRRSPSAINPSFACGGDACRSVEPSSSCDSSGSRSTLPRLSLLLKHGVAALDPDEDDRLLSRRRPRDLSPGYDEVKQPSRVKRRVEEAREYSPRSSKHGKLMPMAARESRRSIVDRLMSSSSGAVPSSVSALLNKTTLVPPVRSRLYFDHHPELLSKPTRTFDGSIWEGRHRETRFASAMPREAENVKLYAESTDGRMYRYHGTHDPDAQQADVFTVHHRTEQPIDSRSPNSVSSDGFSAGHSNRGESVIAAAADFIEERSPTKRESITKLLLKSKEFLKAKSLVRNRNNEIDWVATFLNVGFESNSIYSLMCPLRKGRWKVEEEKYTMELLRLIENGTIRLRHGQSIRGFVAKKLHSDDMRVLKKLSNCKMFHFARMINPRMSDDEEVDANMPNAHASHERLEKLKGEFLRSVQLEALVAVRKYLSDSSIRDLLNGRD